MMVATALQNTYSYIAAWSNKQIWQMLSQSAQYSKIQ